MLRKEDIRIRDPFILVDREHKCYYMYGTTALKSNGMRATNTFSVFKSNDLENFEEPIVVVDGNKYDFWADRDFWAAEVHKYSGKYYLFGSCISEGKCRATHIFVSDAPSGEFVPVSKLPPTPSKWECLDGTFFEENGIPYMVFFHEWTQVHNGEICAVPLSKDLSRAVGEARTLFRAHDNPYVCEWGG